jgi:predicted transposase/invertase (TIGR01784 family)
MAILEGRSFRPGLSARSTYTAKAYTAQIRDAADRYGLEAKFEKGFAQGIEQGVEKGKMEGKMEGKIEVARNMRGIGLAVEIIMQATGLSREQVAGLTA